jgi:hypothetical protein
VWSGEVVEVLMVVTHKKSYDVGLERQNVVKSFTPKFTFVAA